MLRRFILPLLAALLSIPVMAQATPWKIDPNHSSVRFEIRHFFSKVQGQFNQLSGTIEYDPANPTSSKVETKIVATSIDTNNEKRDNHLRSADFFEVEKYPELSFTSTKVETAKDGLKVTGDLTLHGVTKPVVLDVIVMGMGPHPNIPEGKVAGFSARTKINRHDFGIKWNKVFDNGDSLLGDDVDISLEIEAVNAPPKPEASETPAKSGK
ncbi:MAG TPA: YceI family protein [Candidatus Eisenbacteria bacterium]|nr:YceI family protein [Candidatus Eisenbacteria bacterium]